jgi:vitamin B12 transporter
MLTLLKLSGAKTMRAGNALLWSQLWLALCSHSSVQSVQAQPAPKHGPAAAANSPPPSASSQPPSTAGAAAPGPASAAASALEPPKLIAESFAQYPPEAKAQRLEASVLLQLAIDASGQVTGVQILEPAGHGFDEAAREAALRLRFDPAKRDGAPIPSRIRFPYAFKLAPEPPPVTSSISAEVKHAELPEPPPSAAKPSAAEVTEVTVRGKLSQVQRLQQSAEAVNVIDTRQAKEQTADLGEVLARTQGIAVRRDGGLGSFARFSLNGLYDEQVRFFLDGLPLSIAGYPTGIANVPVNLIERVEVYRGVVPVRFGADALGGAVNLVTDTSYQPRLAASYQIGSFGTHRVSLDGRYRHEPSGFIVGASGYVDLARNNYQVDVEVPDARGRPALATVSRFHDAYRAYGATLEAGIVDKPWAKRLLLRGLLSTYDKELQNNIVMSVPYGEVSYGETVIGATARYEVEPRDDVNVELVSGYSRRSIDYLDTSKWVYNWRGERVRERPVAGETDSRPHDQTIWEHTTFGRGIATWKIAPEHQLRASFTPQFATRQGDERIQADPKARDPLTAQRDLFTFVSGLEYELNLFGERLSNIVFVKDYYYSAQSEERLPGHVYKSRDSRKHTQGIGDSLRLRITAWLYVKASYEYATRLPTADEVFGNGVLVAANLDLDPEVSHNGNIGPRLELPRTPIGDITLDVNAFIRSSERLIVLLGSDRQFTYQNVYSARGVGLENALTWSSPGRWVGLDGMLTWQDQRNNSDQGTFADFDGDRIPNRPYLFGSWGARLRVPNLPGPSDTLEPFYNGRYVHSFFRSWESLGLRESKQTVEAQVTHSVGASLTWSPDIGRFTTTFEIDNLSNAKVFDNFGVQRPGRAFYVKISGELR